MVRRSLDYGSYGSVDARRTIRAIDQRATHHAVAPTAWCVALWTMARMVRWTRGDHLWRRLAALDSHGIELGVYRVDFLGRCTTSFAEKTVAASAHFDRIARLVTNASRRFLGPRCTLSARHTACRVGCYLRHHDGDWRADHARVLGKLATQRRSCGRGLAYR